MLKKLQSLLTPRDKRFVFLLLFLSLIVSIVEMIGISAIMPFISVASNFDLIDTNPYYARAYSFLGSESKVSFVLLFGGALLLFYVSRSLINYAYQYLLARFSFGRYHLIAFRLFQNYMGMSYKNFITKNSATLTKAIINEASNLTIVIAAVLFMISEIFVAILIYAMLLFVNYKITLTLTLLLGIKALGLGLTVSSSIKKEGQQREEFQKRFFEIIASSFGNFKLIKLQSNEKPIMDQFSHASWGFAHSNIINQALSHVPRLFLEAVGFAMMVGVIMYIVYKDQADVSGFVPLLSMYVLALYRLLPSVNRILDSYNRIMFHHRAIDIVYDDLNYDIDRVGEEPITFDETITLKDICFEYESGKPVFEGLNLTINKNERVAFVGESGSGKSTLVDIIIGLYKPKSGVITIDSTPLALENLKNWRKKVGYIPQSVYLFDGTVAENVVFGREYSESKIKSALKAANILEFLETKEGLFTNVGEGGVMLSGGQKQRIAIARALYGDPEILVLDEATSALDGETERKIMEEIYEASRDKTLIIIAHRLSTIEHCERIYRIEHGQLHAQR